MMYLSEVLIQNAEMDTFEELLKVIEDRAQGEIHFKMDVKPSYPDTPPDWEDKLEGAFVGIHSITHNVF
ncbi:MAG: hypothetical protein V3S12_06175 [Acidiferrobacterales bacterium]